MRAARTESLRVRLTDSSRTRIAAKPEPDAAVGGLIPAQVPGDTLVGGSRPSRMLTPAIIKHLQASVGNQSVNRLIAAPRAGQREMNGIEPAPAADRELLTGPQVRAAIGYTKRRFGVPAQMIIQQLVGAHVDGDFGPATAQAVALFQEQVEAEPFDGMVGPITLDAAMRDQPVTPESGEQSPAEAAEAAKDRARRSTGFVHLVADLYDLPVEKALSVRLVESEVGVASTRFEAGNLPVLSLGFGAFADSDTLRDAIASGLMTKPPEPNEPGERPNLLTSAEEVDAVAFNTTRLGKERATRVVQGIVGTTPDGIWGPDTVERVAHLQAAASLDLVDGKVGLRTLEVLHRRLVEREDFNAIVRLVTDYFELDEAGLLDIGADDELPITVHGQAGGAITLPTGAGARSPTFVRIKSSGLQTLATAAMTIAHELVHVRQDFAGDRRRDADLEFEAHSESLLGPTLRDPRLVPATIFFDKASLIVRRLFWDMFPDARVAAWPRFQDLRTVVRARFDALPEAERSMFEGTMEAFDLVEDPETRPEFPPL